MCCRGIILLGHPCLTSVHSGACGALNFLGPHEESLPHTTLQDGAGQSIWLLVFLPAFTVLTMFFTTDAYFWNQLSIYFYAELYFYSRKA